MKKIALVLLLIFGMGAIFYFRVLTKPQTSMSSVALEQETSGDNKREEKVAVVDFSFQNLEGDNFKLSDFKGKVIVLNIRNSKCDACEFEADFLEDFYSQIASYDTIKLIPLFEGESSPVISRYLERMDVNFPVYVDQFGISAYKYRVGFFPTSFIIDKKFKIVTRVIGALDWSSRKVVAYLKQLANE